MAKEIPLSEQHKALLALHHSSAKRDEQVLKWLTELLSHKKAQVESQQAKIEGIQQAIQSVENEIVSVESHIQQTVQDTKNNLDLILKKVINEAGVGPKARLQLLFEGGEPKLLSHD